MIHFPALRMRRLTLQLRELTIGQSIAVAEMPVHLEESAITAFLRAATESAKGIADPADWTVQERAFSIGHYLASTMEDGPDFAIGEGHFSDYMDGANDFPAESVELGELGGDTWSLRQLTGAMAESIERMAGEVATGRLHWLLGGMAAQMIRAGEEAPSASAGEGKFDEWLVSKMRVLREFAEGDFAALVALYTEGRDKLHHLLRIDFAPDGIAVLPKGGAALPPARFRADSCLSELAKELVGKPDESGV